MKIIAVIAAEMVLHIKVVKIKLFKQYLLIYLLMMCFTTQDGNFIKVWHVFKDTSVILVKIWQNVPKFTSLFTGEVWAQTKFFSENPCTNFSIKWNILWNSCWYFQRVNLIQFKGQIQDLYVIMLNLRLNSDEIETSWMKTGRK